MQVPHERRVLVLFLAGCSASIVLQTIGVGLAQLGLRPPTTHLLLAIILLSGFLCAFEGSWLVGTAAAGAIGVLQTAIGYLMVWSADPALLASTLSLNVRAGITIAFLFAYTLLGATGATAARFLGRQPTQQRAVLVSVCWLIGFGLLRLVWGRLRLGSFLAPRAVEVSFLHNWPVYAWWIIPPLALVIGAARLQPPVIKGPAAG